MKRKLNTRHSITSVRWGFISFQDNNRSPHILLKWKEEHKKRQERHNIFFSDNTSLATPTESFAERDKKEKKEGWLSNEKKSPFDEILLPSHRKNNVQRDVTTRRLISTAGHRGVTREDIFNARNSTWLEASEFRQKKKSRAKVDTLDSWKEKKPRSRKNSVSPQKRKTNTYRWRKHRALSIAHNQVMNVLYAFTVQYQIKPPGNLILCDFQFKLIAKKHHMIRNKSAVFVS